MNDKATLDDPGPRQTRRSIKMTFLDDLPEPKSRAEIRYPLFRKTWTHDEFVRGLPARPLHVLDVGAGRRPLRLRKRDKVITVDFDCSSNPTIVADLTNSWPFADCEFDLVNLSHVIEHFYPNDRDSLIRAVFRSTKAGGFVFVRVPHRSSFQATGWEHHTAYGMNGVTSLCHGYNPGLPMFRHVSSGAALSVDFDRMRNPLARGLEQILNRKHRLTDQVLAKLIGGIPEVQFLLQRLPKTVEAAIRQDTSSSVVN